MSDAQEPAKKIPMETSPLICGKCQKVFPQIVIEEIDIDGAILQVRSGGLLIQKIEAHCVNCGWQFIWNINEKTIRDVAIRYGQILDNNKKAKPDD